MFFSADQDVLPSAGLTDVMEGKVGGILCQYFGLFFLQIAEDAWLLPISHYNNNADQVQLSHTL